MTEDGRSADFSRTCSGRRNRVRTEGMFRVDGHGRVRDRLRRCPLLIAPVEAGRDESEDLRAGELPIPRSPALLTRRPAAFL